MSTGGLGAWGESWLGHWRHGSCAILEAAVERCVIPVRPAQFGPCGLLRVLTQGTPSTHTGYSEYSHRILPAPDYGPSPPTRSTPARANADRTAERTKDRRTHSLAHIRREGNHSLSRRRLRSSRHLPVQVPTAGTPADYTTPVPHRCGHCPASSLTACGAVIEPMEPTGARACAGVRTASGGGPIACVRPSQRGYEQSTTEYCCQ